MKVGQGSGVGVGWGEDERTSRASPLRSSAYFVSCRLGDGYPPPGSYGQTTLAFSHGLFDV